MTSSLRVLALTLVALLAAACTAAGVSPSSGPSESPSPSGIVYPTGARDLVLRLRYVGGFVAPGRPLRQHSGRQRLRRRDGDRARPAGSPSTRVPALPNLQRATITPAGLQILLEAARNAGLLGPDAHYDLGGIMDAGSAEFTVNADGRIHTVSAYALMEGGQTPEGADPAVAAARAKLAAFQTQLGSLEALFGSELGAWSPYRADAIQLLVSAGAPDDGQGLAQQPVAWPLATPLAGFGTSLATLMPGQRCGVVTGDDLDKVMPLLESANTLTPWTDDGASFGIALRPLLPGEEGCPTTAE